MYLENYISSLDNANLQIAATKTAYDLHNGIVQNFSYNNHISGLLLGNVQSGKTAHMLAGVSKLADEGFKIFLILTTDSIHLQKQTLERVNNTLVDFDVVGEYDDILFSTNNLTKPLAIVLKKNTRILRKWRNLLSSSGYCLANPIVIVDDEADAASLNTLVNKKRVSTINKHLASIKEIASSSIYIEVTATPQSILLQSNISGWKPSFITYFLPGQNYLGGEFFYSEPKAYCIKYTHEDEAAEIKQSDSYIPEGLQNSLLTFLINCGHFKEIGETTCNFLIHPSIRVADHLTFANRLGEHLNLMLSAYADLKFKTELKVIWTDLQSTKPDITNFDDIYTNVVSILEECSIFVHLLNSKSPYDVDYNNGYNIVVGGNSLGRGITLPKLQVVYYCRKTKTPQADTYWQHSRMFGYDRIAGLMRIYTPQSLHKLFCDLNASNTALFNQVISRGIEGIQIILPKEIKPTRSTVVDNRFVNIISGGVNYFPACPYEGNTDTIDKIITQYSDSESFITVGYMEIIEIISHLRSVDIVDWSGEKYANCVAALSTKRPKTNCKLIIRKDRDISKGTGTLLSPNDRRLGDSFIDDLTLTLYRVNGSTAKGWNGNPFWIPNIKFPHDTCYYDICDEI